MMLLMSTAYLQHITD